MTTLGADSTEDRGPVSIHDLDARALPPALEGLEGYASALILVRWRERPAAVVTLPVRNGTINGTTLRRAIVEHAAQALWDRRLDEELGLSAADAGTLPASATVAVCTRDRPDDLERCLAALERLPDDGQDILVVDSASTTLATADVVSHHPRVRLVREERPGLDRARNRAMREARGEIVAFTDDDAAPDPGWLRALRAQFGDPRTLCVTGLTMPVELATPAQVVFERTNAFQRGFARRVFDGLRDDPFNVARAGAGVNMALRRTMLDAVGEFDEALDAGTITKSGGDHDMFSRILLGGYRIVYTPDALTWHRHRRDWAGLRDTLYGYGCGVYAHLTGHVLRGELGALRISLGWLRAQVPGIARAIAGRPGAPPLELALAELRGCAAGPLAYIRSRRAIRAGGAGG